MIFVSPTQNIRSLLRNKPYIFITLALSILYFIISGIQFWISDYLRVVLEIEAHKVFVFFSFTCITAPTFGVIVGGVVIHSLGGY